MTLLEVDDLTVTYRTGFRKPPFTAVRNVSLTVERGETVSIVGESGSGKSTIGGAILGLRTITGGAVRLNGEDITRTSPKRRRELSAHLQAIFQDPFSSLDPSMTIGDSVAEPLQVAAGVDAAERYRRAVAALGRVGVAANATGKYPAEFSGGQRQRISIARSVVRAPELVICDEAVSALDVSVQAHVLNLLAELKERSPDRVLATNVEFWSAVVLDTAAVPPDLFTSMFTCARVAGWSAHVVEQQREGRLIRPTAKYVGAGPRPLAEV